jgi:hypothetical protein
MENKKHQVSHVSANDTICHCGCMVTSRKLLKLTTAAFSNCYSQTLDQTMQPSNAPGANTVNVNTRLTMVSGGMAAVQVSAVAVAGTRAQQGAQHR